MTAIAKFKFESNSERKVASDRIYACLGSDAFEDSYWGTNCLDINDTSKDPALARKICLTSGGEDYS